MKKNYIQYIKQKSIELSGHPILAGTVNPTGDWQKLNYGEFWTNVEKVAAYLLTMGIERQQKIAVYSQNMPQWLTADLAIMSLAAVTVPLYPTASHGQAEYILKECEAEIVFVGQQEQYDFISSLQKEGRLNIKQIIAFDGKVKFTEANSVYFDSIVSSEYHGLKEKQEERTNGINLTEDIATIIYTSGTTGEPKGVILTHGNVMKAMEIHDIRIKVDENDISLCFLPLSHVFERGWSWVCLYKGALSYCLSNPKAIVEVLPKVAPTAFCTVPRIYEKVYQAVNSKMRESSFLKRGIFKWAVATGGKYSEKIRLFKKPSLWLCFGNWLADNLVFKTIRKALGGRLRICPTAGAHVPYFIVEFFHSVGIPVLVGYGLSETTASVTVCDDTGYELGSIGKPLKDIQVKIGVDNEILVKGDTVMKGYYKKPEATKEVFYEGGWFRTGDAGYLDDKGNLFITERLKDLIKTSQGKYVAPQQVESALLSDTMIEQVLVIGDKRPFITALIVPNFEKLKDYAKSLSLKFASVDELIKLPKIIDMFHTKLEDLQKNLASYEMVKRFALIPREFSIDLGELTPTLKVRRKIIMERWAETIQAMYV